MPSPNAMCALMRLCWKCTKSKWQLWSSCTWRRSWLRRAKYPLADVMAWHYTLGIGASTANVDVLFNSQIPTKVLMPNDSNGMTLLSLSTGHLGYCPHDHADSLCAVWQPVDDWPEWHIGLWLHCLMLGWELQEAVMRDPRMVGINAISKKLPLPASYLVAYLINKAHGGPGEH